MIIAALFTIARAWKQPKCPSAEEWVKKVWYIYMMEYYSSIKRDVIGSFVETWIDLEIVIQSEVGQREKNKYHILTNMCGIYKNGIDDLICKVKIDKCGEQIYGYQGGKRWGRRNWEVEIYTHTVLILCIKCV